MKTKEQNSKSKSIYNKLSSGDTYAGEIADGFLIRETPMFITTNKKEAEEYKKENNLDCVIEELKIKHGKGVYSFADGQVYIGEWKNDKYHGIGTLTYPDGKEYSGEWKNGLMDGKGTLITSNGSKVVGEFRDDMANGKCIFNSVIENDVYIGEFVDDQRHGQGTLIFPDGEKYIGEFLYDEKNGYGTNIFPNGDEYKGEWKDDKFHGKGTKTYSDGTVEEGIWEKGSLIKKN